MCENASLMGQYPSQIIPTHFNMDPFWFDQPSILFDVERLIEFFPTNKMTLAEKLNALVRFSIYASILLYLSTNQLIWVYIPFVMLIMSHIIYTNFPKTKREMSGAEILNQVGAGKDDLELLNNYVLDKNGKLCQQPTKNNPFMNVLISDYMDAPNRPAACNPENPEIMEKINQHFNHNLYRNINDVWERGNSQRQFVVNPTTTIPNDRESAMNWFYKTGPTCKDGNLDQCMRYEDVRFQR